MTESAQTGERRERKRTPREPKHRDGEFVESFSGGFEALADLALGGAELSAKVVDVDTGRVLVAIDDAVALPVASIGKVLVLIEVAARIARDEASGLDLIDKPDLVGDSGLWQYLQAPSLPMADLAVLCASVSDNLATNALLAHVGLDAVRDRTDALGLRRTALLDLVRDVRGPDDAPQLSVGSAKELAQLFAALGRGEVVSPAVSRRVMHWLGLGCDLSMVASAFGLDPLAHRSPDHDTRLVNKTGTDDGIRSEVGVLRGSRAAVAYAVSVRYPDTGLEARLHVLEAMRTVGVDLLEYVH